jgi:alkaline phosphatase D
MKRSSRVVTRRRFLADSAALATASVVAGQMNSLLAAAAETNANPPHQAMGTKAGEVTDTSAIIWTRLTAAPARNTTGPIIQGQVKKDGPVTLPAPIDQLHGACPGAAGRVRVHYGTRADLSDARTTDWVAVNEQTDFTHQFALAGLKPATQHHYAVESEGHGAFRGKFITAPPATTPGDVRFCVTTCEAYHDREHEDGHPIYPPMLALAPHFAVFTGDAVYYDSDEPAAKNAALARYHWQRMFSLPRQIDLLRNVATYWEKDDHDTQSDDTWPTKHVYGELTFQQGQQIFREQAPMSEKNYRTFRWGRDLQIWLSEGRDFRSPNNAPDGPEKTIWGAEQKAWFKRTVAESDATWKVLVNPTPVVGPDRLNKKDNLSNAAFQHEGDEIRAWLQANVPDNFFVVTGDRHWQYHSIHPQTKVREFSCGPASNAHASGSPGENPQYHQFHRVKGGFFAATVRREGKESVLLAELRDVNGAVVHSWEGRRPVA